MRYVSSIGKNLISVGVLEAECCKVSIQDDIMKVFGGALFLMKAERMNNLYFL